MDALHLLGAIEIGDGARHPENAMEPARGKTQDIGRLTQEREPLGAGHRDLLQHAARALGVGAHSGESLGREPLTLAVAGGGHAHPNLGAAFARRW